MAAPPPPQPPVGRDAPIPIATGTRPPAPPGMVAVPAAALSGRQQQIMQQAGANIGVMTGLATGGGADIVTGAVAGGFIGQQLGRYQRAAAMSDQNAPMVFVDVNSRAGRRAIRRQKRQERRSGVGVSSSADNKKSRGWFKSLFGGGSRREGDSGSSDGEGDSAATGKENKPSGIDTKK